MTSDVINRFKWPVTLIFVLTWSPLPILSASLSDNPPTVDSKSGPIVGVRTLVLDNKPVNVYYGIPYAQPPIDQLRFRQPLLVEPWNATLQATKQPLLCYQEISSTLKLAQIPQAYQHPWSEDCLTLTIWTSDPQPQKAPVMVWLHGGGFTLGGSVIAADGSRLALEGVVVVSVSYRLGVFGFLNMGTPEVSGNMGLMDQSMALQWVKNNIEAFGGDPEAVTVSGISAGGASVGFHLLSPMSRGLFKRAIAMSGVPTNYWATREQDVSVTNSEKAVDMLGCKNPNATQALDCMQQRHPEDILEAVKMADTDIAFPTVDGRFIVEHPSVSVSAGRFNPADLMIGTARDDGADFMTSKNPNLFKTRDGRLFRGDVFQVVKNSQKGVSDALAEVLKLVYTDWSNPEDPFLLRDSMKELYTDSEFSCHTNQFAYSFAKLESPVYRYIFNYSLDFMAGGKPSWVGANHGNDQYPVMGAWQMLETLTDRDNLVFKKMIQHFANFVKSGDPNLLNDFPNEPKWPPVNESGEYNLIDAMSTIHQDSRRQQCTAWLTLRPMFESRSQC